MSADSNLDPASAAESHVRHLATASPSVNPAEVTRLAELIVRAEKEMKDLVDGVRHSLSEFNRLREAEDTQACGEIESSLARVQACITSAAEQLEEIATAAVVTSTQSLANMWSELRRAVAEIAIAHAESDGSASRGAEPPQSIPKA